MYARRGDGGDELERVGMIQCGLDAPWRLSKSLPVPLVVYLTSDRGTLRGLFVLKRPDDAQDDRENISFGGALSLETINAPSNRAWKITSGRNGREGKETRGGEEKEWSGHDGSQNERSAKREERVVC